MLRLILSKLRSRRLSQWAHLVYVGRGWRASLALPGASSPSPPPSRSARPVHSAAEFMALAAGSLQLRAELATSVHANSSRSHLIITATLTTAPARGSPSKWPRAPGQGTE